MSIKMDCFILWPCLPGPAFKPSRLTDTYVYNKVQQSDKGTLIPSKEDASIVWYRGVRSGEVIRRDCIQGGTMCTAFQKWVEIGYACYTWKNIPDGTSMSGSRRQCTPCWEVWTGSPCTLPPVWGLHSRCCHFCVFHLSIFSSYL